MTRMTSDADAANPELTAETTAFPGRMETFLGAVMAGLVPAIPIVMALCVKFVVAGTSPAMTAHV